MKPRLAYPLRYVRPHPGPRPPVWRIVARRRWKRAILERNLAKKWNFGAQYGAYVGTNYLAQTEAAAKMWDGPADSVVIIEASD